MVTRTAGDAVAAMGRLQSWQIIVLMGTIIVAFYWPVFRAHFSIPDDHEVISYLFNGRIAFTDIWEILTERTEAGHLFESSRYRPIYYVLRLIETWMWADWATPWFLTRLAILTYFSFEAFRLMQRHAALGYAAIFFLTILFSRVFVDSLLRLGAAESYAALGCALCMTGARKISRSGLHPGSAILVAIGTMVAVGSKENFVFLLLPLAMLTLCDTSNNRFLSISSRILTLSALIVGLITWSAILPGTFGRGATFYLDSLPKLSLLASHPVATSLAIAASAGAVLLFAGKLILSNRWLASHDPRTREALLWTGLFVAAIILQFIVYREFVTRNRYGFPAIHMLIFLGLLTVSRIHEKVKDQQWSVLVRQWTLVGASAVALLLSIAPEIKAWSRVQRMVQETVTFQARYSSLAKAIRRNPNANIVFIVHRYDSYEPIVSVQRYLFRDFGNIPIAVSVEGDIQRDTLATELTRRMREWQQNGGRGFIPLHQLNLSNCIGVGFRGQQSNLPCPVIVQMWPLR